MGTLWKQLILTMQIFFLYLPLRRDNPLGSDFIFCKKKQGSILYITFPLRFRVQKRIWLHCTEQKAKTIL